MKRFSARILLLQVGFALAMGLVLLRAAQLQLVEGAEWARRAAAARTSRDTLPARRGTIYDRRGEPLAITQEFYHVGIAPNEATDARLGRLAARALGLPLPQLQRELRTRKWVYAYGPYTATQIAPIRNLKGVHPEGFYRRSRAGRGLAGPVVGQFAGDSGARPSGLERSLDALLTGQPGEAVYLRDQRGRRLESPQRRIREPVAGNDIWLTLDAELQDIAERALEDALRGMGAAGGDVIFLEPRSGEILAVASRQLGDDGRMTDEPTAFTTPFQPGSTAKLFTAAALLRLGRVDSTDRVSGEGGHYEMPLGDGVTFTIEDVHAEKEPLTLADAIRVSSNIAMAKFSTRLSDLEQFEALRDFGFGSPSGVEFPSESRGVLAPPERWTAFSKPSHAMGYELSVTALQLAAAYAAIANDGVLVTPTLVREVRGPDGRVLYRHRPEPVRRVMPGEVAATLRRYLRAVVSGEGGTGDKARVANFDLAGKTGTARRIVNGRYEPGGYRASFAALGPADDPQVVVVVTIDRPTKGSYYGGSVAAPVAKSMLEQALASRRIAIDRARLVKDTPPVTASPGRPRDGADDAGDADAPVQAFPWPALPARDSTPAPLQVPAVTGRDVRAAALALHRRGFRIELHGRGTVVRTDPAAGATAPAGSLVAVWTSE